MGSTEGRQLDRARGALLGLAVGDALGGPVEFLSPDEIHARYHGEPVADYVGGGWLDLDTRSEYELGYFFGPFEDLKKLTARAKSERLGILTWIA